MITVNTVLDAITRYLFEEKDMIEKARRPTSLHLRIDLDPHVDAVGEIQLGMNAKKKAPKETGGK